MATYSTKETYSKSSRFYDDAWGVVCDLCDMDCVEQQSLACGHVYCERCLTECMDQAGLEQQESFNQCPECTKHVAKHKKVQRSSEVSRDSGSTFYTDEDDPMAIDVNVTSAPRKKSNSSAASIPFNSLSQNIHPVLRRSAPCHPNSRSAMIFTTSSQDFESRISTDSRGCIYWGGDVTEHGDIVLADWYNHTLKLFSKKGEYMTSLKYFHPPLGVTVLPGNVLLVSFGSTCSVVCFVSFEKNRLRQTKEFGLPGHVYSTARYKKDCLGIIKPEHRRVSLAVIGQSSVTPLRIGDIGRKLATESGLAFNQHKDLIYFTQKKTLFCIKPDGTVVFERHYTILNTAAETSDSSSPSSPSSTTTAETPAAEELSSVILSCYSLGSIATDAHGDLFIASDHCVLHVTADGDLHKVIPTHVDPYHVIIQNGGSKCVVVGKDSVVELLPLIRELTF